MFNIHRLHAHFIEIIWITYLFFNQQLQHFVSQGYIIDFKNKMDRIVAILVFVAPTLPVISNLRWV
jgi:hypothetical protein